MAGDYQNTANKGRGGDALLRFIDGELSHVNAFEAWLVDNHGERGEGVVQRMGSGTINPKTGLREYQTDFEYQPVTIEQNQQPELGGFGWNNDGGIGVFGGDWGSWGRTRGLRKRLQAKKLAVAGVTGLAEDYTRMMGPGGSLEMDYQDQLAGIRDQQRGLSDQAIGSTYGAEQAMFKSGLETSGRINTNTQANMDALNMQSNQLNRDVGAAARQKEQAQADLLETYRTRYSDLVTAYQDASGKMWEGDDRWGIEEELGETLGY